MPADIWNSVMSVLKDDRLADWLNATHASDREQCLELYAGSEFADEAAPKT